MGASVTITTDSLSATSSNPCECCGESTTTIPTCSCDDGICCWSDDASVNVTYTYIGDVFLIHHHWDDDLGWVPDVDCSGDGTHSLHLYHVNISFTVDIPLSVTKIGGCCTFTAGGWYCRGSGGGYGCPPDDPDARAPTPGLTVSITDIDGDEVPDIDMSVTVTLQPNCTSGCAGWTVSGGWSCTTSPEVIGDGKSNVCAPGNCTHMDDANMDTLCYSHGMLLGDPYGWGSWTAYQATSAGVKVNSILNHCCRDSETMSCKPGDGGAYGVRAVDYWKQKGLSVDFMPYRVYAIGGQNYFEFFAVPYDRHLNPATIKGVLFDTNRSWDYLDDEGGFGCLRDMLNQKRVSAYGNRKDAVGCFQPNDFVFYYHKGRGIVGAAEVKGPKLRKVEHEEYEEEWYWDVRLLTPPPKDYANLPALSKSEVEDLLGHSFYYPRIDKRPYLSREECELLLRELRRKFPHSGKLTPSIE